MSAIERQDDLTTMMHGLGRAARQAAASLAIATAERKHAALVAAAAAVDRQRDAILAANALDMDAATAKGISAAFLDRLRLDGRRLDLAVPHLVGHEHELGVVVVERPLRGLARAQVKAPLIELRVEA